MLIKKEIKQRRNGDNLFQEISVSIEIWVVCHENVLDKLLVVPGVCRWG